MTGILADKKIERKKKRNSHTFKGKETDSIIQPW